MAHGALDSTFTFLPRLQDAKIVAKVNVTPEMEKTFLNALLEIYSRSRRDGFSSSGSSDCIKLMDAMYNSHGGGWACNGYPDHRSNKWYAWPAYRYIRGNTRWYDWELIQTQTEQEIPKPAAG